MYLPTLRLNIATWWDVSFKWQYGDRGTDAAIELDCDRSIVSVPQQGKYVQEELYNVQVDIHGCLRNSAAVQASQLVFHEIFTKFAQQIWLVD